MKKLLITETPCQSHIIYWDFIRFITVSFIYFTFSFHFQYQVTAMLFYVALLFGTFVAAAIVHWLVFLLVSKPSKVPNGPMVLPIVGNMWYFLFQKDYYVALLNLQKTYGKAVTLFPGLSTKAMHVMVFDYDLAMKIQSGKFGEVLSDRPENLNDIRGVTEGIVWGQYSTARHLRSLVMRCFKESKLSYSPVMTPSVQDELGRLLQHFAEGKGSSIDPIEILVEHVTSSITLFVLSKRIDLSLDEHRNFLAGARGFFEATPLEMMLLPYLQILSKVVNDSGAASERYLEKVMTKWLEVARQERLKEGPITKENVRDILDVYLMSQPDCKQIDPHFMRGIVDVYLASMETGSVQLSWLLFYLAHQPEEQENLFQEIEEKIGSQLVQPKDRDSLPKLLAYIEEMHRYSVMTTQGFPRRVAEPIDFGDNDEWHLEANTNVMFTWTAMQSDPKYWGDPENFRPSRWIDPKTGKLQTKSQILQFGLGKRVCPGENVGRNIVFCFIAAIIQRFKWRFDEPSMANFTGYKVQLIRQPPPYKLIFEERN